MTFILAEKGIHNKILSMNPVQEKVKHGLYSSAFFFPYKIFRILLTAHIVSSKFNLINDFPAPTKSCVFPSLEPLNHHHGIPVLGLSLRLATRRRHGSESEQLLVTLEACLVPGTALP